MRSSSSAVGICGGEAGVVAGFERGVSGTRLLVEEHWCLLAEDTREQGVCGDGERCLRAEWDLVVVQSREGVEVLTVQAADREEMHDGIAVLSELSTTR